MLRVLSETQVQSVADVQSSLQAVEAAYSEFGRSSEVQSRPPIMTIAGPRPTLGRVELGQFRVKGASIPLLGVAGAFLYTRDHPYLYLWDLETDAPVGLVAGDWLSQFRVALTIAFAIRTLGPPVLRKIAFFGAGKYATESCKLLGRQLADVEIQVISSSPASAAAFASKMPGRVVPGKDPRSAIRDADVVVTLTNAKAPFVEPGWLNPGALLLSMGSAHEVHIGVLDEADTLIVDDLAYAMIQGDFAAWVRRGELQASEIPTRLRGNIGEIAAGLKPGRIHAHERILAILQGLTACDVAVAKAVLDRATAAGVGQTVTLG